MTAEQRVVGWFSCGDASAVACKLMLAERPDTIIARCIVPEEHSDNDRFAADCARWYGKEIVELRSTDYASCQEVWEKRRYMSGIAGAPCTTEMKKVPRFAFQRADDIHVWGFTADKREVKRAQNFAQNNPELYVRFPLIEHNLSKADCHGVVRGAGIALAAMYLLDFDNNNCIGCVKAQGATYWNRVRRHFPDVFRKRAELSREIGCRLVKYKGQRIFLDELPEDAGDPKEIEISCSPFCEATLREVA